MAYTYAKRALKVIFARILSAGIFPIAIFLLVSFSASAQVTAVFSATPLTGCAPFSVDFNSILSTGSPNSWNWDFGNGNNSVLQNPSALYLLPGSYTVTLTVSNGSSTDTEIKTNYIVVYNKPVAGFTMSEDTACVGQTITFTDATVIAPGGFPIVTWSWGFGDAQGSLIGPVTTHAYTTPGTYPVSVIVTDAKGCVSTTVKNILVVPKPTASFTASPTSSCTAPLIVNFTNTSSAVGGAYLWKFGDATTSTAANPSHTYTAPGTYTVTLIVYQNGGCIDSIVKPNLISIQNMAASFTTTPTPAVVCVGVPITFNNTSVPTAVTANWDFGNSIGTSTVLSPTYTYPAPGTFTVTLTSFAGACSGTTTGTVIVNPAPVVSFTADTMQACSVPFTVNFTNTSTGASSYVWDFGDGPPTSTLTNPTHTYTAAGSYNVSLTAFNATGTCSITLTMNNFIQIIRPVASFIHTPDSGCVPLTVTFTSTSTSPVQPIISYIWNFGDTAIGVPTTTNTYTTTGVFPVSLIVQTAGGCADTIICPNCIKVGDSLDAGFTIVDDSVCFGIPVQFNDTSTGTITGWEWHFGDGNTSISQNPSYVYGDTGTFNAYLIGFNNGCADTAAIHKVVILPPQAIFNITQNCTNYYSVLFCSTSKGADSLVWDFGDGFTNNLNVICPTHIYLTRGTYTIKLTAYNYSTGCSHSTTLSLTIAEPIAGFTAPASGCYDFFVPFNNTSQDENPFTNSSWWNFGDPSTLADTAVVPTPGNATYTYGSGAIGQNTVTLIITDVNGCKDTATGQVTTLGPIPGFYADTLTGCRPFTVTFVDTTVSDSALVQWIWNFGDGTPDTTTNDSIVHTYTNLNLALYPWLYTVTMTVRDTNGCVKSTSFYPIQPTFPFPSFTVDTFACKGDVLLFDASATVAVTPTYTWDFGDGPPLVVTTSPFTTHAYANDGLYTVSLTVTDRNGCDSTITHTVLILKPTAAFNWTVYQYGCGYQKVYFDNLSTGYVNSLSWNFGNNPGVYINTLPGDSVIYQYTDTGTYYVTLIVTNLGGCKDTIVLPVIVDNIGPLGSFTFSPTAGCNPLTVCFDATSPNAQFYIWDFADGTVVANLGDTCHTYTTPGTFNPVLLLVDTLPNGNVCTRPANNLTGTVTVTNVISVALSGPPTITLDEDSIVSVSASYSGGTGPYTYSWTPNIGINCNTCQNVLIIGTGSDVFYTFTITDATGCIGIDSLRILSLPCFEEKWIPNVFSPNNDGYNDMFYIPGVCPSEKYSLQIYNRWGMLMFSTTVRNNGWDGRTIAGVDASDGVYYFITNVAGNTYKGFLHLVR